MQQSTIQNFNPRLRQAGHPPVGHTQHITNEWEVRGRWNDEVTRPRDEQVGFFKQDAGAGYA